MYIDEIVETANREFVGEEGSIVVNNIRQKLGPLNGVREKSGILFVFQNKIIAYENMRSVLCVVEKENIDGFTMGERCENLFIGNKDFNELIQEVEKIIKIKGVDKTPEREKRNKIDARVKEIKNELPIDFYIRKIVEDEESGESYVLNGVKLLESIFRRVLQNWEKQKCAEKDYHAKPSMRIIQKITSNELGSEIKNFGHYFNRLLGDFENLQEKAEEIYGKRIIKDK